MLIRILIGVFFVLFMMGCASRVRKISAPFAILTTPNQNNIKDKFVLISKANPNQVAELKNLNSHGAIAIKSTNFNFDSLTSQPNEIKKLANSADELGYTLALNVDPGTDDFRENIDRAAEIFGPYINEAAARRKKLLAAATALRITARVGGVGGGGAAAAGGLSDNPSIAAVGGIIAGAANLIQWLFGGEKAQELADDCDDMIAFQSSLIALRATWLPVIDDPGATPKAKQQAAEALKKLNEDFQKARNRCNGIE